MAKTPEKIIIFKPGDKVFAKIRGSPPWPAKITNVLGNNKFGVQLYGTQRTANIHKKDLAFYQEYKNSYVQKYIKRAKYVEAVKQIEEDLVNEGVDINNQISFDASNPEIDRPLEDASITFEKSTSKQNDIDQPAAADSKKRGRPKKKVSETNSEAANTKKFRRDSSSSDDMFKEMALMTEDNNDQEDASRRLQIVAEILETNRVIEDKEEIALGQNQVVEEPAETEKSKDDEVEVEIERQSKLVGYKKPKDDLEIITKKMLNNLILYAGHVRKNRELFMAKPVEARENSEKDIYAFKLPSGKVCGVKLYRNSPPKHKNEYERTLYDEKIAKAALEAEILLTNERKTFEDIDMEVVPDIEITESDLNSITSLKDSRMDAKKRKITRLNTESKLLDWDTKIRSSLGSDSTSPDTALNFLKEFREFVDLDALMFKKHPQVLDTVKRLREYFGDTEKWNRSDSELEFFEIKAAYIRIEAGSIYRRLQSLFPIDPENEFWNSFLEIISDFEEKCKDLIEDQIMELCDEPDSRQAFFDML